MKSVTADYRETLRGPHKRFLLVDVDIGSDTYRISNADTTIIWEGQTYSPVYVKDIDEIEMTSEPTVNDVDIPLDNTDRIFGGLVLSQSWMNKPVKVTRLIVKSNGVVAGGEIAFIGLLSDFIMDYEDQPELVMVASSIWKDFEKLAGITNNSKSQQRFYPTDTSMDHVHKATRSIYWGKVRPSTFTATPERNVSGSKFDLPGVRP